MTDNTILSKRDIELIARAICAHLVEKSSISDLRNSLEAIMFFPDKSHEIAVSATENVRAALQKRPDFTEESPDKKWLMVNVGYVPVEASEFSVTTSWRGVAVADQLTAPPDFGIPGRRVKSRL